MTTPLLIDRAALVRDPSNPSAPIRLEITGSADLEWTRRLGAEARRRLHEAMAGVVSAYEAGDGPAKLSRLEADLSAALREEETARHAAARAERDLAAVLEAGDDPAAAERAISESAARSTLATIRRKALESAAVKVRQAQQAQLARQLDGARQRLLETAKAEWRQALHGLAEAVAEHFTPANVAEYVHTLTKDRSCVAETLQSLGFDPAAVIESARDEP